jgi:hypothetical protein
VVEVRSLVNIILEQVLVEPPSTYSVFSYLLKSPGLLDAKIVEVFVAKLRVSFIDIPDCV